jgi:hypothetical protein
MITNVVVMIASAYLFLISFMMSTNNFASMLLFKFVPFALGIGTLLVALKGFAVI